MLTLPLSILKQAELKTTRTNVPGCLTTRLSPLLRGHTAEEGRDMKHQWGHPTTGSPHGRHSHGAVCQSVGCPHYCTRPGGSDVAGHREENRRKSSQCHNSHRKGWLETETRPSQIFLLCKGSLTGAVLCEGSKTKQRRSSLNKKPPDTSIKIKKGRKTHFPLSKATILSPDQEAIKHMFDHQAL